MNNTLFDTLLQSMKDRFPKLSWKLGSVIRTLLIEPLTEISKELNDYVVSLRAVSDIQEILNNPENNEAALNKWLDTLGIAVPESSTSTGTIIIKTDSKEPFTIAQGTRFTWNDEVTLYASRRYDCGTTSDPFTEVSPRTYIIEIQVSTGIRGDGYLRSGAPINWDSAPSSVTDMYVQSTVGGGIVADTALKAEMLRAALTSPTLSGIETMRAALIRRFPGVICDAVLGNKYVDAGNCIVPLYVKQNYPPTQEMERIPQGNVSVDPVTKELVMIINTAGALEVQDVLTTSGVRISSAVRTQFGAIGDSDSYMEIRTSQFTDSEVAKEHMNFTVRLLKYPAAISAINWLNEGQRGLPYVVRGEAPAYATIKLQINCGGAPISTAARTEICEYINRTNLNETITDAGINNILRAYGLSVKSAILYVANVHHGDGTLTITDSGAISAYGRLGIDDTPVAMYCCINDIESY